MMTTAVPRYDLPTLHRPATLEDTDQEQTMLSDLTRVRHPIPTPPHKDEVSSLRRVHSSVMYGRDSSNRYGILPTMLTDTNWRTRRAKQQPVEDLPAGSEFDESYEELNSRKAYRHPHPGVPKGREGCMGGTWRHTREAIGYGPGRLMWIDGVVTLYDDWQLNYQKPWSAGQSAMSDRYNGTANAINAIEARSQPRRHIPMRHPIPQIDRSDRWYSSNRPQPLPFADSQRTGSTSSARKYKGFYSMSQTYN